MPLTRARSVAMRCSIGFNEARKSARRASYSLLQTESTRARTACAARASADIAFGSIQKCGLSPVFFTRQLRNFNLRAPRRPGRGEQLRHPRVITRAVVHNELRMSNAPRNTGIRLE